MSTFRRLPFFLLSAVALARAQTLPPTAPPAAPKSTTFDSFVVTAGLDG